MTQPMTKPRARGAALFASVALAVVALAVSAPAPAMAQAEQSGIVGRIVVQGNERIEEATLLPGDEVQIGKFKLVYLVAGNE